MIESPGPTPALIQATSTSPPMFQTRPSFSRVCGPACGGSDTRPPYSHGPPPALGDFQDLLTEGSWLAGHLGSPSPRSGSGSARSLLAAASGSGSPAVARTGSSSSVSVKINAARECQRLAGFGVSEGFGQAEALVKMPGPVQDQVLNLLYSPTRGAGLTISRRDQRRRDTPAAIAGHLRHPNLSAARLTAPESLKRSKPAQKCAPRPTTRAAYAPTKARPARDLVSVAITPADESWIRNHESWVGNHHPGIRGTAVPVV